MTTSRQLSVLSSKLQPQPYAKAEAEDLRLGWKLGLRRKTYS